MEQNDRIIKKYIGELNCPHNFRCCRSGFKDVCKAKDIGLDHYLVCLQKGREKCKFLVPFGGEYFCSCPLRVHIAKCIQKK